MVVRIKTSRGFFRDVRPRAGLVTLGLMFLMAFLGGAVGMTIAAIYCLPMPVAILALVGLGELMIPVFGALGLIGGGAATRALAATLIGDRLEAKRTRQQQLARRRPDPGPWSYCSIRQDKLRDSIMTVSELRVVPRRWR